MARSAGDCRPRDAERAVLYRVIDEYLDAFGVPLPAFEEQEFRDFLTCGVLAHGFARLRCSECALERLVPFSCKGRGFCPSCGGRRMSEGTARLVDGVLPRVPVRQWVLSLPYRLRYVLAWDHGLARAVLGVAVRVQLGIQRQRARRAGIRAGRSGSVPVIQRFGGGLNLNVHFHTLLFDGVFFEGPEGTLEFRPLPPPTDDEVGGVLARIAARVQRLLRRRGLDPWEADGVQADPLVDESPALAGLSSASVQGRIALGPRAGARMWRLGDDPDAPWVLSTVPPHAHLAGFDLHANVAVPAADRARLEQRCRYLLRPAVAQDRLRRLADGRVVLTLKSAWADGTRHSALRAAHAAGEAGGADSAAADQPGGLPRRAIPAILAAASREEAGRAPPRSLHARRRCSGPERHPDAAVAEVCSVACWGRLMPLDQRSVLVETPVTCPLFIRLSAQTPEIRGG